MGLVNWEEDGWGAFLLWEPVRLEVERDVVNVGHLERDARNGRHLLYGAFTHVKKCLLD